MGLFETYFLSQYCAFFACFLGSIFCLMLSNNKHEEYLRRKNFNWPQLKGLKPDQN
jgi:hypothetical protein